MSSLDSECVHLRDCEQRKFCEDLNILNIDFPKAAHVGQGPRQMGNFKWNSCKFLFKHCKANWVLQNY